VQYVQQRRSGIVSSGAPWQAAGVSLAKMHLLDVSFADPARNLACDEAVLDELEADSAHGLGQPTLRFWESSVPFVVVGYGNKILSEVNLAACRAQNIAILRRTSGGGTVVQGPGCLNYTLTLPIADETANITSANCFIMSRNRDALSKLLGKEVQIQGHTDLTVGALKFSGNAQRRKSRALLFHGCFLLHLDFNLIEQLLLHPTREPDYRGHRSHREFLTNLPISRDALKTALIDAWSAGEKAATPSHIRIEPLVHEKYNNPAWNEKF
jgi:lipoate-protein ligase A